MFKNKKVFIFDVDGTLAKSKLPIDREMAKLLARLTQKYKVAAIGGGKISLFKWQILEPMKKERPNFGNLFLFPTSGASFYRHNGTWKRVYELRLSGDEAKKIRKAFKIALSRAHFEYPKKTFGILVENRGTQITFSALGQLAPLSLKKQWNRKSDIRPKIMRVLKKILPDFEIRRGGLTSIDVTKKGVDKGYAIRRLMKTLKLRKQEVVFFGDALYPGGNDYSAKRTGVKCVRISSPAETGKILTF